MRILIENEIYPIELLNELFDDPKFYKQNGLFGTLTSVGYYHSFTKNSLVFMLPKVFMAENRNTVFNCTKEELIDLIKNESLKHKTQFNWARQLSVYFYNSLIEYKKRITDTTIVEYSKTFELNTNLGSKEYSYLDLVLTFVNFYKKNKQQILFKHIDFIANQAKKPKWEKTIRKSLPIFINSSTPIYIEIKNKKKIVNTEEELLVYFYSILHHLNVQHYLYLNLDKSFEIIKGKAFERLCLNGSSKLRKIKYRYFNDTLKKMYTLCGQYFSQYDKSNDKRKREDFLAISNYNLVFEDMIDKLFSDDTKSLEVDGITIDKLKHNDDGKIIDHIYDYQSLVDRSNIFYIGDSKYYKSDNFAGKVSKYKQFTYAKNVIQFNIDLLNNNNQIQTNNLRYRDKVTEGYNISPNFFIYGYIDDVDNFDKDAIEKKGNAVTSYHFKDRLFDRDTLFVHQYKINFLYVLKTYTHFNNYQIQKFRDGVKDTFRKNFIEFFNDKKECEFEFYKYKLESTGQENFLQDNFRILNGKCFCTIDNELLLARHKDDDQLDLILGSFEKCEFS